jgi:CheY-like chemotaxis protein
LSEDRGAVVVVEDDNAIRDVLTVLLRDEGYEVEQAGSAEQALEILARRAQPCVVITDLVMPGISGLEFASALKKLPGHERTRVVLFTALKTPPNIALRVIRKPIGVEEILATIQEEQAALRSQAA